MPGNAQLFKEGFVMKKWRDNAKGTMQYCLFVLSSQLLTGLVDVNEISFTPCLNLDHPFSSYSQLLLVNSALLSYLH